MAEVDAMRIYLGDKEWKASHHAVDRYVEFIDSSASRDQAALEIISLFYRSLEMLHDEGDVKEVWDEEREIAAVADTKAYIVITVYPKSIKEVELERWEARQRRRDMAKYIALL